MQIFPSILVATFSEFEKQVHRMETIFPYIQIDIMDGKFVPNTSFVEVEKVKEIKTTLRYELHLMVQNPLAEMKKWQSNNQVFQVIFPVEAEGDHTQTIAYARERGWRVGMVLNPDTPLAAAEPYYPLLDLIMLMTVYPGKQGQPFVDTVKEKIKAFTNKTSRPLCAVDGAVNKTNVRTLQDLGVDIAYPGSALMKADDVRAAYAEILKAIA